MTDQEGEEQLRIYCDESVNIAVPEGLLRRGFDVRSAHGSGNLGISDRKQIEYARKIDASIFTHDTDFLRIVSEGDFGHEGIIYAHQKQYSIGERIRKLRIIIKTHTPEELKNQVKFL